MWCAIFWSRALVLLCFPVATLASTVEGKLGKAFKRISKH